MSPIRVGALLLLLASLLRSPWLSHSTRALPVDLMDFLLGLLYTLSIGFLLLGVRRSSCRSLPQG